METVFDHGITPEEQAIIGPPVPADFYRKFLAEAALSPEDQALAGLYRLFTLRGDRERAAEYRARIRDKSILEPVQIFRCGLRPPPP